MSGTPRQPRRSAPASGAAGAGAAGTGAGTRERAEAPGAAAGRAGVQGRAAGGGPPRMGWKAAFFGLVAVAIVAAVAWALLGSRFLIVRSVKVSGTGPLVSRAKVLAAAQIPAGLPLIRVNSAAVARRVERITQVQSARVSRQWPSTVAITIQIRSPVFVMTAPGGYALLDSFGVDVRSATRRPRGLPLLSVGGSRPDWPGWAATLGVSAVPGASAAPSASAAPGRPAHRGKTHSGKRHLGKPRSGKPRSGGPAQSGGPGGPAGGPGGPGGQVGSSMVSGSLRGSPQVRAAALVLRELPPWIARHVQAVWAATGSDVSVRLTSGVMIVWGDPARPGEKAKELAVLMHSHARLYDVSGPGTAMTRG